MLDLYTASKLAPEDEIRLVSILPRIQAEDVACELRVVRLPDNPKYIALSYTWGSPISLTEKVEAEDTSSVRNYPILCRAKSDSPVGSQQLWYKILVTKNLHAFLLRTRDDESHALDTYWIDAICINQEDSEEQTRQVKMMTTIYQSANIVHAWLGEEDKDTAVAFQLIKALAKWDLSNKKCDQINSLKDLTPKTLATGELTAEHPLVADVSNWKSMARLFHRTYFTRVWIVQEITLAKKMSAICGVYTIDWADVVKVSEFLTVTSWTRWMFEVTGSHQARHAVPNILDANKTSGDLLYSLIRSRRFVSGDPRDKVYALLGIVGESVRAKSRLTPIYGERSVEETYTLAAAQILEDSEDLLLLSCAEGDIFCTIPSLPSWVPDWSCSRSLGLGVTGYRRFSAAGDIPRALTIHEWDRCLTVKGSRLDDIASVGERKQDILSGDPFPDWLRIINALPSIYHTGQARSEVFWRTLITDTAGAPPRYPAPDSYYSAFVSWITSKLSACIGDSSFINSLTEFVVSEVSNPKQPVDEYWKFHNECLENSEKSVESIEFETVLYHAIHLRLFLTSKRYLGVGSESLRENDSIWIIPGSRVPLILQEVGTNTFRVVGGAYVHGFMEGQALESGPIFRDITLV